MISKANSRLKPSAKKESFSPSDSAQGTDASRGCDPLTDTSRYPKYKVSPAGQIASRPAQRARCFPSQTAAGITRKGDRVRKGNMPAWFELYRLLHCPITTRHNRDKRLLQN